MTGKGPQTNTAPTGLQRAGPDGGWREDSRGLHGAARVDRAQRFRQHSAHMPVLDSCSPERGHRLDPTPGRLAPLTPSSPPRSERVI